MHLDVKIHPKSKGRSSRRQIALKDVLYAPSAVCNVLGGPIMEDYGVILCREKDCDGRLTNSETGATVALFDLVNLLYRLLLVGQPRGKASLDPNGVFYINVLWSEAEQERWILHNDSLTETPPNDIPPSASNMEQAAQEVPPYTTAEKAWLKRAFGAEFKLLRCYGLSIYDEEDREEGRLIARGMIEAEATESEDEEDPDKEANSFLDDLENDLTLQHADQYFSAYKVDYV